MLLSFAFFCEEVTGDIEVLAVGLFDAALTIRDNKDHLVVILMCKKSRCD